MGAAIYWAILPSLYCQTTGARGTNPLHEEIAKLPTTEEVQKSYQTKAGKSPGKDSVKLGSPKSVNNLYKIRKDM